jgi:mortality factor 4-like protein 1
MTWSQDDLLLSATYRRRRSYHVSFLKISIPFLLLTLAKLSPSIQRSLSLFIVSLHPIPSDFVPAISTSTCLRTQKANKRTSRWDEWVPQERLRELNTDNQELAKMLKKEVENMNKSSRPSNKLEAAHKKRASSALFSENSPAPGPISQIVSKKRGRDIDTERVRNALRGSSPVPDCGLTSFQEDVFYSTPKIEVNLPDPIKSILVDDWENVTKNLMLAEVPHPYPVSVVLEGWKTYDKWRRSFGTPEFDQLEEAVNGMKAYFNVALGKTLLYTFERDQYSYIYKRTQKAGDELEGKAMADIYGPEHLLRLLSKF